MKYLYLDVDGVLSPFSDKPPRQNTGWTGDWGKERVDGFAMLWSHELVERLNTLATRAEVEIIWTTDWLRAAPEVLSPAIGLLGTEWAVLEVPQARIEAVEPWWKMQEIAAHLESNQPEASLWVDDNINYAKGIRPWLRERGSTFLTINPNRHHGITKKDMVRIESFLA